MIQYVLSIKNCKVTAQKQTMQNDKFNNKECKLILYQLQKFLFINHLLMNLLQYTLLLAILTSAWTFNIRRQIQPLNDCSAVDCISIKRTKSQQIVVAPNGQFNLLNVPDVFQYYNYSSGHCSLEAIFSYYQHPAQPLAYRESQLIDPTDFDENNFTSPEKLVAAAKRKLATQTAEAMKGIYDFAIKENMSLDELEGYLDLEIPVIALTKGREEEPSGSYIVAIGYDSNYYYFQDPWMMGSIGYVSKAKFAKLWETYIKSENRLATKVGVIASLRSGVKRNVFPLIRPCP